jgi:catechol 2,3-dioxygenase
MPAPTTTWPGAVPAPTPIDPATRLGAVHLTVSDLGASREFWTQSVGLREREGGEPGVLALHAGGEDLVVLHAQPGARPVSGRTGLFHVAILLPTRADLADWLAHALRDQVPLSGLSDHWVSEAIYLRDPDHHGIEIYADRPQGPAWERGMTTLPLAIRELLAEADEEAEGYAGMPQAARIGHVHLHVSDLPASTAFYVDVLGFDRTTTFGDQADFWSAGGYHHHLAGNVWAGVGAPAPEPGSAALRHLTVVLPSPEEVERVATRAYEAGTKPLVGPNDRGVIVRDPSHNALLLTS